MFCNITNIENTAGDHLHITFPIFKKINFKFAWFCDEEKFPQEQRVSGK